MGIVITVIQYFIQALCIAIFARAIFTLIMPGRTNLIIDILYHVTEPILSPVRRIFPTTMGGIDFSPTVAIVLLLVISMFISMIG